MNSAAAETQPPFVHTNNFVTMSGADLVAVQYLTLALLYRPTEASRQCDRCEELSSEGRAGAVCEICGRDLPF